MSSSHIIQYEQLSTEDVELLSNQLLQELRFRHQTKIENILLYRKPTVV